MNKEQIKTTLAGIGIAGLIAGVTVLTGCQKAEVPSDKESLSASQDATTAVMDSAAVAQDSTKASCGAGSCGQGADTTKTSCGQ